MPFYLIKCLAMFYGFLHGCYRIGSTIFLLLFHVFNGFGHSVKTRPVGLTRGWNRAGLKKKQGKKKPGVTRSKTRL
jgi:hypothetical protein